MHLLYALKSRSVWQCVLLRGFKRSLSHSVSGPLMSVVWSQNISTLTAARPGWVTLNKVSGSSLDTACVTFLPFICMRDWHFAAQHVVKDDACRKIFFVVMVIVLNQYLPLALSQLTTGHRLKKVKKPAGESLRANQALVTSVDYHGGSQAWGCRKWCRYSSCQKWCCYSLCQKWSRYSLCQKWCHYKVVPLFIVLKVVPLFNVPKVVPLFIMPKVVPLFIVLKVVPLFIMPKVVPLFIMPKVVPLFIVLKVVPLFIVPKVVPLFIMPKVVPLFIVLKVVPLFIMLILNCSVGVRGRILTWYVQDCFKKKKKAVSVSCLVVQIFSRLCLLYASCRKCVCPWLKAFWP